MPNAEEDDDGVMQEVDADKLVEYFERNPQIEEFRCVLSPPKSAVLAFPLSRHPLD